MDGSRRGSAGAWPVAADGVLGQVDAAPCTSGRGERGAGARLDRWCVEWELVRCACDDSSAPLSPSAPPAEGRTDGSKEALDTLCALGRDLEEEEPFLLGKELRVLGRNGALRRREVELVPGEADDDRRVRLALQFENP